MLMIGGAACFKKCENLALHRFTIDLVLATTLPKDLCC